MKIVGGLSIPDRDDKVAMEQDGRITHGRVLAYHADTSTADVQFNNAAPDHPMRIPINWLIQGDNVTRHRATDMPTAVAAAQHTPQDLNQRQTWVLLALADAGPHGLIDHEHQRRNTLIPTSAGKRRLELKRRGLVEPTGKTRPTGTGDGAAAVWACTQTGYEVADHIRRRGLAS